MWPTYSYSVDPRWLKSRPCASVKEPRTSYRLAVVVRFAEDHWVGHVNHGKLTRVSQSVMNHTEIEWMNPCSIGGVLWIIHYGPSYIVLTYIYMYIYNHIHTYIYIYIHMYMYIAASTISHGFWNMFRSFFDQSCVSCCVMQVLDLAIEGTPVAGLGVKVEHIQLETKLQGPTFLAEIHNNINTFLQFGLDQSSTSFQCDRLLVLDLFGKKKRRVCLFAWVWVDRSGPKLALKHEGCNNWDVWQLGRLVLGRATI